MNKPGIRIGYANVAGAECKYCYKAVISELTNDLFGVVNDRWPGNSLRAHPSPK
jgi:hypothetical protein